MWSHTPPEQQRLVAHPQNSATRPGPPARPHQFGAVPLTTPLSEHPAWSSLTQTLTSSAADCSRASTHCSQAPNQRHESAHGSSSSRGNCTPREADSSGTANPRHTDDGPVNRSPDRMGPGASASTRPLDNSTPKRRDSRSRAWAEASVSSEARRAVRFQRWSPGWNCALGRNGRKWLGCSARCRMASWVGSV